MSAWVDTANPVESGWSQVTFSAEYYSEGESSAGEGEGSGEFNFDVPFGEVIPDGAGPELNGDGPPDGPGMAGPYMLTVGATEAVREYWDSEGNPLAIWDNINWTVEVNKNDGEEQYTLTRDGDHSAGLQMTDEDIVTYSLSFTGDTTAQTDFMIGDDELSDSLQAQLVLDFVLLDPSQVNPEPIDYFGPGSDPFDPIIPPDASDPGDPWVFQPITIGSESPGTGNDPVFFDPEIAIGYRYRVEDGDPDIVGVILPVLGDNRYDIYLVDENGELVLPPEFEGVEGDVQHILPGVDEFVVLGVDEELMLDPNDTLAFVTGLIFGGTGTVHLMMTPIVIPEPASALLAIIGVLLCSAWRGKRPLR
jgi:hypothetical protein